METFKTPPKTLASPSILMNTVSANLRGKLSFFNYSKVVSFCSSSLDLATTPALTPAKSCRKRVSKDSPRVNVKVLNAELKEKWLASLSSPPTPDKVEESTSNGDACEWVIGIDPDVSGALAVLKSDGSGYSAEVFDNPHVQVLVGKRVRKRLDANAIVQMLQRFDAPFVSCASL